MSARESGRVPPPAPSALEPDACPYPALPVPYGIRTTDCPDHPCGYLRERTARMRAFATDAIPGPVYQDLMDAGFRRSGRLFYQPTCAGCRACLQIRVRAGEFVPSRSQRRWLKRNADLSVRLTRPEPTREKYEMFRRYLAERHDGQMSDDEETFRDFLYDSPTDTIESVFRDPTGKLVAAGILDASDRSLSSVYFYYDPDEAARRPGTYGALAEIDLCRRFGLPYYYLGYWVKGCGTMEYKAAFRPCEALHPDGVWREIEAGGAGG